MQKILDTLPAQTQPLAARWANAPITVPQIRQRLAEAAHCLNRLPMGKHGKPACWRVSWPDIVYDWLAYGWLPARLGRIIPTPGEIDRMDEVLSTWLPLLTADQRTILWARANHWGWRKLEALDELERSGRGRTERQLRNLMYDGEARILSHLNGTPKRLVVPLPEARA